MFKYLAAALIALLSSSAPAQSTLKYALGDVVSIDELPLLVAVERAKKRGVNVEVTAFKSEEIATQAVINGQADIGQGTPYAAVEKVNVPIRFFYQLSSLQFYPIVNKEFYKSWKDLDGQEIVVHARGSGTEAIMNLMAKQQRIKYKNVSYVPGSQVRAVGLLKGNIKASILDASNKNYVMKEAPGKFIILPLGRVKASDEALFARKEFLEKNQAAVAVLVEELIRVNRQINKDPGSIVAERKKLGLLKDLPAKLEAEILPYFKEGVETGIFPNDGGGERAAKNDLEFFHLSGALKSANTKVENFWTFAPLKAALAKLK
ncbi:MAG: nitrate ABC transporter substrate-binding protein [Betaproteobacteria bacterium RIFCSPLOWO2_12_FULL_65_14]|nr:MAG: nitrate ABC transporter substrate-binding protein [Betaproteobacteria bacterium RIFCSPLOWO2_12_FULL_65_14]